MEDVVESLHLSSLPSGHVETTQESTTGDSFVSDKLGYEVRVLCVLRAFIFLTVLATDNSSTPLHKGPSCGTHNSLHPIPRLQPSQRLQEGVS